MIRFTKGNLMTANAEALVNTVNTVGVMGKGIALQFKEEFPKNFTIYANACKSGELVPGKLLITKEKNRSGEEKTIINFPTKLNWRNPSKYEYIKDGLTELVKAIEENQITSIATPARLWQRWSKMGDSKRTDRRCHERCRSRHLHLRA